MKRWSRPRRRAAIGLAGLLAGLGTCAAWAQATQGLAENRRVLVAATENRLWLVRVQGRSSTLTYRDPSGEFAPPTPFNGVIETIAAVGSDAFVFQADGSFYRFAPSEAPGVEPWHREYILPGQAKAVDVADVAGVPYALVPSTVAAELPVLGSAPDEPESQPFEAGAAPLSLVCYGGRGWQAVAPCPLVVPEGEGRLRPRLCYVDGHLYLFWSPSDGQVSYLTYAVEPRRWQAGGTLGIPGVEAFWVAVVNRLPTLVADVRTRQGEREIQIYRLVGEAAGAGGGWRRVEVELSPLPPGAAPGRPQAAFGFNQHLGLLVTGGDGSACLRFGRFSGPPALETVDVFAPPPARLPPGLVPMLRMALTLTVIVAMFAFRRGALATPVDLPPGMAVALTFQRLVGCVVDLFPFSLLASLVLGVSWSEAVRAMSAWAFDPQLNNTGLPEKPMLAWWALTVGGGTLATLLLELRMGRSAGKILLGLRVCSEKGTRAGIGRILVRNAFRLIELLPPCWILGFVIVLSRNRQRVGDVFAGTVVVRAVPVGPQDGSADRRG